MAKSGDVVVLPFATIVAVLETGNVHVQIPTHETGRPTEDAEIVEFDQKFLRFVKLDGAAPSHPIALPPGSPGTPTNPIVIPGRPAHPIAPPLPGSPGQPDNTLPGGGHVSGQPVPGGGGHPSTQPIPGPGHPSGQPVPPGTTPPPTTKPVPPAEPKK